MDDAAEKTNLPRVRIFFFSQRSEKIQGNAVHLSMLSAVRD